MHGSPPDPSDAKRRAKLKRDYRRLIDGGGAVLKSLPVRDINGLTEALIELRWLKEAESEDRKALAAAVGALIDDYIASRSR